MKRINEAVEKKLLELLTATAKVDEMPKGNTYARTYNSKSKRRFC